MAYFFMGAFGRGSVANFRFRRDPARPGPTGHFDPRVSASKTADLVTSVLGLPRPFWAFQVRSGLPGAVLGLPEPFCAILIWRALVLEIVLVTVGFGPPEAVLGIQRYFLYQIYIFFSNQK